MARYNLSKNSLNALKGVHPDLVAVTKLAITKTKADFTVFEGLRTVERQAFLVRRGDSQTMNGKHLIQPDGFGHAVDLVPYIGGKVVWDWPACYLIADAVRDAANELGVKIRWGGCWSVLNIEPDTKKAVAAYVNTRLRQGQKAFTDGPHYEIVV